MIRFVALCLLILYLPGCGFTQWGDTFKSEALDKGAQAYDEGLVNAELIICRVSSVRSIMERYWTSPVRIKGWLTICYPDVFAPPPLQELERDPSKFTLE